MRKKIIFISLVFLILIIIFVSFLNFPTNNFNPQNKSSKINLDNKDCIHSDLIKNLDLKLNDGNLTMIRIISISDPGGILEREDSYYTSYISSNLSIKLYLYDLNYSNNRVLDEENLAMFSIIYNKTSGTNQIGTLNSFIKYDNDTLDFNGIIETSNLVESGNYTIKISIDLLDYKIYTRKFYITFLKKYNLDIFTNKPDKLIAGEKFDLPVIVGNIDNSNFFPLKGVRILIKIYVNNKTSIYNRLRITDQNGRTTINFIVPLKVKDLSIDIIILESYFHYSATLTNLEVEIIPYGEFIIVFSFYFVLLILSIGVIILISFIFSNKRKRKKDRILREFMLLFEDISKVEHIFIVHKKSNQILIKKSYISKQFDFKLLDEYISFIFSSNNFIRHQNSLREFNFNNKILLVVEGKYLIIGIILKNKISDFFKNQLNEFLNYTETLYKNDFSSSNFYSNSITEIEKIFENRLNISINSPYSIESDKLDAPLFTKSYSKHIYNLINDKVKEKKKNSFYLSEIFSKFSKQTRKGIFEFLIGITELKNIGVIIPIKNDILK